MFVIFSVAVSAVVQHLLNFNFWVTSIQATSGSLFFGNLSTNYALSLALDNFSEIIDRGKPSPTESGFYVHFTNCCPFVIFHTHFTYVYVTILVLALVLDECLAELLNSNQCMISGRCLQIMSLNSESHGYHLTHKYVIV